MSEKLSLSVSLSRKVNLGNYESADVFLSISGITDETTGADMDELLAMQGALAYRKLASALKTQVEQIKEGKK